MLRHKFMVFAVLVCLTFGMLVLPGIRAVMMIPGEFNLVQGETDPIEIGMPWGVSLKDTQGIIDLSGIGEMPAGNVITFNTSELGRYQLSVNLLGFIPLRQLRVNVIPPLDLVPGGHSIGVKLSETGVMVAGLDVVSSTTGNVEPGKASGFKVGDIIYSVNGIKIKNLDHASAVLEELSQPGRELTCKVLRDGKELTLRITPVFDQQVKRNRLGLLLRDTGAGVGTLTFFHPPTGKYGALGHMITDGSASNPMDLSHGRIVNADIISIQPGKRGAPGEKRGTFPEDAQSLGSIDNNSEFGIFGSLYRNPQPKFEAIPLGMKHQVKTGKAEILTVVKGSKIERFEIEIEKVIVQNRPASKGMVIRVTAPRLLEITGGIVQGMSGSPIIQNGRLVGAVTHVFINEPERGYGCFAEWMVLESGILEELESFMPSRGWKAFFIF